MMMVELLETIFQVFNKNKSKPVEFLMNVNGTLERKGIYTFKNFLSNRIIKVKPIKKLMLRIICVYFEFFIR